MLWAVPVDDVAGSVTCVAVTAACVAILVGRAVVLLAGVAVSITCVAVTVAAVARIVTCPAVIAARVAVIVVCATAFVGGSGVVADIAFNVAVVAVMVSWHSRNCIGIVAGLAGTVTRVAVILACAPGMVGWVAVVVAGVA